MNNIDIKNEFTFRNIFQLIKLHKKFVSLFIIIFLIAAFIYSLIVPYEYQAIATVLPSKQSSGGSGLSSFLQGLSGGGEISFGSIGKANQSQVNAEILKSRAVAKYVVEKLELKNTPDFNSLSDEQIYDAIRSMLDVDVLRSGIIEVISIVETSYFPSSSDKDSASILAANIANTAIEGLDNVIRMKNVSSAKRTRMYIEGELLNYRKRLDSIEGVLEKFQSENKVLEIDEQTGAILNQAISLGADLTEAEIKLNFARQEYDESSSTVRALKKQVEFLRSQYEKIQKGGLISTDAFSIPLKDVPRLTRIFTNLVRDRKIIEKVILYLETQRHQEAIQEERDIPVVEQLDIAVPPEVRSAPSRKLMLILAFILSSFLAVTFIVIRASYKGKVEF